MGRGKKRGRSEGDHPRNKYSDNPPDFALLASLYPSFNPFVFFSGGGRPRIDWTDYNATRELTRILLLHDHDLNWWIPDGQLCPTVPNRSNYIHWINDLLSSQIIQCNNGVGGSNVKGFDIGTGANCIYPLLGASLFGWSFVASDFTLVALEWAAKNVQSNPHISDLIEIRDSKLLLDCSSLPEVVSRESEKHSSQTETTFSPTPQPEDDNKSYDMGPAILLGLVKENETFDFCMSNPPFFETFEEAGLNPKTSCGGTPEEMVCAGGERAFVTRIIEDSTVLRQRVRWYTSMLGKKANLKLLISKLWEVGVTVVKTTEFVQGQTSRWGLAWSFMPTTRKVIVAPPVAKKSVSSFMLEGIKREYTASDVLQSVEEFFKSCGASCKSNASTFSVDIVASSDQCNTLSKNCTRDVDTVRSHGYEKQSLDSSSLQVHQDNLSFRILVFQQMPGTLLIKGSLKQKDSPLSGLFTVVFGSLEETMKYKFCR